MQKKDMGKRPLIYYAIVAMLVIILLNTFVFPLFIGAQVQEVGYSDFLDMLDEGKVSVVSTDETQLTFIAKDDSGKERVYKTGIWQDDGLTERLRESDVKFAAEIPTQSSPLLSLLLTWILPILIFMGIGMLFSKKMKTMGANAMTFGKSGAKIYAQSETGMTFADVAGEDEAKEALSEIVDFLHDPKKYAEIGANLPKGALLVGPPGTGKTLLAKAVAGEAKVPFFSISGSEFVEMFVGMGAAKVRDLFKQAAEKAPCIVFIDEIDTIGKRRDNAGVGGNDEREQTLNQLLTEMDGFDGKKGVVILAATNRPEILDKALLRPGRFDRRIPVELPDLQGRKAIFEVHAKRIKLEEGIDFDLVARATAGASGAEIANIVNEAALRAVREGRNRVSQEDLMESVEVIIAGYQRKNAVISEEEKRIVAFHEIGHALVAASQTHSAPVSKITIIPRTSGALGYTMQVEEGERVLLSKEEAFQKLVTLTGGRAAEEIAFGTVTSGAANDIEQATKLARAMVSRYGMSDAFDMVALEQVEGRYLAADTSLACSAQTAAQIDQEVIDLIRRAHITAKEILTAHRDQLDRLAQYLLEKENITGEEFMALLNDEQKA